MLHYLLFYSSHKLSNRFQVDAPNSNILRFHYQHLLNHNHPLIFYHFRKDNLLSIISEVFSMVFLYLYDWSNIHDLQHNKYFYCKIYCTLLPFKLYQFYIMHHFESLNKISYLWIGVIWIIYLLHEHLVWL